MANVGDSREVDGMFQALFREFPRLDILVNNAGVQTWKALLDLEEREWDRTIDTNLKGCYLCTQRAGAPYEGARRRAHRQYRIGL